MESRRRTPHHILRDPACVTDQIGALASSVCAVHCALCAAAPAAFAALGLGVWLSHEMELGLTIVAVIFGTAALGMGWRRHKSPMVAGLLTLGIVGLLLSRVQEMSSEHHGHHGDSTQDEIASGHDGHAEHKTQDLHVHHGAHDGHEEAGVHLAGEALGILAGLLLCIGHIVNLRAVRRCRHTGCEDIAT